jgi:hypothetical protein
MMHLFGFVLTIAALFKWTSGPLQGLLLGILIIGAVFLAI